jgi:dihydroorotate dehydrogenase (NAD+) catalytic subunit
LESLKIKVGDIDFKNSIVIASGPAGFGEEFFKYVSPSSIGAFTTKTVTPKPKDGNPPPRIVYAKDGLLNSIGLQNPGVDAFVRDVAPYLPKETVRIISIGGESVEDFVEVGKKVEEFSDMIEINLSCPNVREGGTIASNEKLSAEILSACSSSLNKPLIAKLSPDGDILKQARVAVENDIKIVNIGNSLQGAKFNIDNGKPFLKRVVGGLSGPALLPITLWKIYQVKSRFPQLDIIGLGGVNDPKDVLECAIAGASLVSIGTYAMANPQKIEEFVKETERLLKERNVSFEELVASAHKGGYI